MFKQHILSLCLFSLALFGFQHTAFALRITKIRNNSSSDVTLTYASTNYAEITTVIPAGKEIEGFELLPASDLLTKTSNLEECDSYLRISTHSGAFLSVDAKMLYDNQGTRLIRYGTWLQKAPKITSSRGNSLPTIRCFHPNYPWAYFLGVPEDIPAPEQEEKPLVIVIEKNGSISPAIK